MGSIAVKIASKTLKSLEYDSQTLFQKHGGPLVANKTICVFFGFDFRVWDGHRNACNVYSFYPFLYTSPPVAHISLKRKRARDFRRARKMKSILARGF